MRRPQLCMVETSTTRMEDVGRCGSSGGAEAWSEEGMFWAANGMDGGIDGKARKES